MAGNGITPYYVVKVSGKDVSGVLFENNTRLTYTDSAEDDSDEICIETVGSWIRPKYEDELEVWLGYKETELWYVGKFLVQSTTKTRFSLTINATAANFTGTVKEKRNKSYDNMSLGQIAKKIAGRYGLKVKTNFTEIIEHVSQNDESDINLLGRMAEEYNAIFQIKNKTLIFVKRESETLPLFTIEEAECTSWSIEHSSRKSYRSCKALWHDLVKNKKVEVVVGSGEPQLLLSRQFKNEAEAHSLARAHLDRSTRGTRHGNIQIYGQNIKAGGRLRLIGFEEEDDIYSIKTVEHTIDSSGYSISVEFENIGNDDKKWEASDELYGE